LQITTLKITAFSLNKNLCPLSSNSKVIIDNQEMAYADHYVKNNGTWEIANIAQTSLRKRHGLQGPIDDAFMESFLIVTPTGRPQANPNVTDWIATQQADAIYQWKMQFRGQPRVKTDTDVTDDDIRNHNLALWGDPTSNALLKKVAPNLPIQWHQDQIAVGSQTFTTDKHLPVFVFPNPLNPERYVVINSGFTFAANGSQSNSTQTPKLPDWAIVDITAPAYDPLRVVAADFFGEYWEL
ncbi:MAG: hypothetical protein ACO36I_26570, partial [Candidatus Latescibacterota bacterium]